MTWDELYHKTWLAWPQFDARDHEYCELLDQNNLQAAPTSIPLDLLPYTESVLKADTSGHRSLVLSPWRCGAFGSPVFTKPFPIRVWQRW